MFDKKFYQKHFKSAEIKAGSRYSPKLNVNIDLSGIFNWLTRSPECYASINNGISEIKRNFRSIRGSFDDPDIQNKYENISLGINELISLVEKFAKYGNYKTNWEELEKAIDELRSALSAFGEIIRVTSERLKINEAPSKTGVGYVAKSSEVLLYNIRDIYSLEESLRDFSNLFQNQKGDLFNNSNLLLIGGSGTGKTHLLCDLMSTRIKKVECFFPTILCFGENISQPINFWDQVILNQLPRGNIIWRYLNKFRLGRFISRKIILQHLDRAGRKNKCKSLIIIDAINENIIGMPNYWKENIEKILKELSGYKNIAFIISCRSGFENQVLTKQQQERFILKEHNGFRFSEGKAVNIFFREYSIPMPEIPMIISEFQNPLFLKLFCEAFTKRRGKKKPAIRGHEGATYIFETYIDAKAWGIETRFSISHGPNKNIWDTIIEKIAEKMVELNNDRISKGDLIQIISRTHSTIDPNILIQSLESEMLITQVPLVNSSNLDSTEFDIRFPFQKFSDHLVGRYIFKKYLSESGNKSKTLKAAKAFFGENTELGKFISNSWNIGIIEALSIQCPEYLSFEFIDIVDYLHKDEYRMDSLKRSFFESLIWRKPTAFSDRTFEIARTLVDSSYDYATLLNSILSVAPVPGHPFNADYLHKHLSKLSMPGRDIQWSSDFLYYQGDESIVSRLIEWARAEDDKSHISDESILLMATVLIWLLSTSNRFIRDTTTKALVNILYSRIHLIKDLLNKFKDIDDPYISERLYAVGYGSILKGTNCSASVLDDLANYVYTTVFEDGNPPTHILLRDYARGIIEVAGRKNKKLGIDPKKTLAPFKSKWNDSIPSKEDLEKIYKPDADFKDGNIPKGLLSIWMSVMDFGDFSRYVLGTNSNNSNWTDWKIGETKVNKKELVTSFRNALNESQKKLFDTTTGMYFGPSLSDTLLGKKSAKELLEHISVKIMLPDMDDNLEKKDTPDYEKKLLETLSDMQKDIFKKEIQPYIKFGRIDDNKETFDLKKMQRWILARILELGYDNKTHGIFDDSLRGGPYSRDEHKAERIGKKYQWIAYHEFMGLISDHFEYRGEFWISKDIKQEYLGAWSPHTRDIDPSLTIQSDIHIHASLKIKHWSKSLEKYYPKKSKEDHTSWCASENGLPKLHELIEVTDDESNDWLLLEGSFNWSEETPSSYKKYDLAARDIWYGVKSYIIKTKDVEFFTNWAKDQNFMGRWMPESHNFHEIYLGEYPSSLAYKDLRGNYNIRTKIGNGKSDPPEILLTVTDDQYLNEFTLDCSGKDSLTIRLPGKWLVDKLKLIHTSLDGRFYNKDGELIAIPTNIFEHRPFQGLLIRKEKLLEDLDNSGYSIVWTMMGEKRLMGGDRYTDHKLPARMDLSGIYTQKTSIINKYFTPAEQ